MPTRKPLRRLRELSPLTRARPQAWGGLSFPVKVWRIANVELLCAVGVIALLAYCWLTSTPNED